MIPELSVGIDYHEESLQVCVLNKEGEVQLVTNYKDSKNDPDWKSDKPMVKRIVLPLLEKKLIETK